MKIKPFLEAAHANGLCSAADPEFLESIAKKATRYLLFYKNSCAKSNIILKEVPTNNKILLLNQDLDWVKILAGPLELERVPGLMISKSGQPTGEEKVNLREISQFLLEI